MKNYTGGTTELLLSGDIQTGAASRGNPDDDIVFETEPECGVRRFDPPVLPGGIGNQPAQRAGRVYRQGKCPAGRDGEFKGRVSRPLLGGDLRPAVSDVHRISGVVHLRFNVGGQI